MKTKKLLMALALPVALASCTADDFLAEQTENAALAGRKVVGNISFVNPEGADTKMVYGNDGLEWTESDKLGAALMDTYDGTNYTLSKYLFTNYRYDFNTATGKFDNKQAVFVEGNYFVYGQHNAQNRSGLAYSVPKVQTIEKTQNDPIYDNQMLLDHFFAKEGDSQVALQMRPVFPAARFTVTYEGEDTDLTIERLVLTDLSGTDFGVKGYIDPTQVVTYDALAGLTLTKATEIEENPCDANKYKGKNLAEAFTAYKTAVKHFKAGYFTIKKGDAVAGVADMTNPILHNFFVAADGESTGQLELNFGESGLSKGALLLPLRSEAIAEADLQIEIYTNKGVVTLAGTAGTMSNKMAFPATKEEGEGDNKTTVGIDKAYDTIEAENIEKLETDAEKQLARAENAISYSATIAELVSDLKAGALTSGITIKFKDDAIIVPAEITVHNTAQLEEYLSNWYEGKKASVVGGATTVVVNAVPVEEADKIEISQTVLDFIANTENNPALSFKGTVVIPAGTTETNVLDKLTSQDLEVINEADNQAWTDETKKYATITNNGTLTLTGEDKKEEDAKTSFTGKINNFGTLTVEKKANITSDLVNGSEENKTAKVVFKNGLANIFENNAVVEVDGGLKYHKTENNGEWTVKSGTMIDRTKNSTFTNNGTVAVAANANWNASLAKVTNAAEGTVTNNGKITVVAKFDNQGAVENNSQIACSGEGVFYNNGEMDANANSITLITENNTEIIVVNGVTAVMVGEPTKKGKITYIVESNDDLKSIPAATNSLRITASEITLAESIKNILYVEFLSDGTTITAAAAQANATAFDNVKFTGATEGSLATFKLNGYLKAAQKLEVNADASVIIYNELEYAGDAANYTNAGQLLIAGTLHLSTLQQGAEGLNLGTYFFTGGDNSNIKYAPSTGTGNDGTENEGTENEGTENE